MTYRLAADTLVLLHLTFVLFVVLGGLLALRWRWIVWLHLPAAAWGTAIEWAGWICPLTPLENRLRAAGGDDTYTGDFVGQYILPIVYPAGLTRALQIWLGLLALTANVCVYMWLIRRWRRGQEGTDASARQT